MRERLAWNLQESQKPDFADRMAAEVRRKGCQVIRIHVSGDFASQEYAEKWLWVMRNRPKPRYYFYTRSFRCPEIAPVLEQMAALRCCRAWYSVDKDGMPESVPPGVRLAYLQVEMGEKPELVDLRFAVRRLRKSRLELPMQCPQERGVSENCGDCRRCFA